MNTTLPIDKNGIPLAEVVAAETHWYAAYTCANHEKKAAAELERRSVKCFLPLYASVRRWQDRQVKLELPLFPGYLFVRMQPEERLRVLQAPGVVHLVSFGNRAAVIAENEIAHIREILQQGRHAEPHPYLNSGRRVRVKAGPLAGLEGIVVRRKKGTRFVVTVKLIQRAMSVEVDGLELEPLLPGFPREVSASVHG